MKNAIKIFTISILGGLWACEDVYTLDPVPATETSTFSANFLLVNATPDAPALDLYINNVKAGASVSVGEAQSGYTTVPITSNAVIANTNIRSSAATGTIGGILGSNNLIYRATSTSTNNFTATNGLSYTIVVVDSINRPKPIRTLNALDLGDVTYYSSKNSFTAKRLDEGHTTEDTVIYLNVPEFGGTDIVSQPSLASSNPVAAFNTVKLYNGNVAPTFMTPIGVVPLGSSDVGGLRYYLWRDFFQTFTNAADSTTKAGFRTLNASPNSGALRVRLKFVSGTGADIVLNGAGSAYAMSNAGGQTPSVGSNTPAVTAANFTLQTIAPAGTPNTYNIEVLDAGSNVLATQPAVQFGGAANRASSYTIVVSGFVGGSGTEALKIIVAENN